MTSEGIQATTARTLARSVQFPVWIRLALRELRGGLKGFRVFLICLALGVAAIAAVGSVRATIEQGLAREAASLLGGDAEVEFTYRFADPDERAWMGTKAATVSEIVDFRSMATPASLDPALVQVKAVDGQYPLYGSVVLAGGGSLADALDPRDGLPGLVAERTFVERLGLAPGAIVRLGTRDFCLADTIVSEPDPGSGFSFGPRVIVHLSDLADSGLLAEGSLFDSSYRLRLPPGSDLAALKAEATARFGDSGLQWRDRRDGAPGVGRFVDRLGSFLILVGLAGLAVGGVGVAAAVRAHMEARTATIAVLKSLGATGKTVFAIYFAEIGILALLGIALGLAIGAVLPAIAVPFLADRLPVPVTVALHPRALAEAGLYGLLTAFLFTLWPLGRTRSIRPAELFRDITASRRSWPHWPYIAGTAILALLLVGAATWFSGAPQLALGVAGGVVGALILLLLAARALRALANRFRRSSLVRGRPALRWALGALGGPSGETASVVLALGLGLSVLAAIGQIDANLRALITRDLPSRAPAFFFVDIQNDQLSGFLDIAHKTPGITDVETAPMLRGLITRINGRPALEVAGPHWALNGDRGVTYAATPPAGTTITEGAWWSPDDTGPPQMSFAAEEARELGLKLGDRITLNVLGRDITATITSFRDVRFQSMGINFLMILSPSALAGAPHTHIATVYAGPGAEAPLLRAIAAAMPNVTAISVRDAINRAATTLTGIGVASRWAAGATLITGLVVLIGAAAAGESRRTFEAAVLKTLGASRGRILASFALRSALIGAAAGLVALAAGALAALAVMTFTFETSFRFEPLTAMAIVVAGALASLVAGLVFAFGTLSARPARVLRSRE